MGGMEMGGMCCFFGGLRAFFWEGVADLGEGCMFGGTQQVSGTVPDEKGRRLESAAVAPL